MLADRFRAWVDDRLGDRRQRWEAVFLEGWVLLLWSRSPLDLPPLSRLDVLPAELRFPPVEVGAPPIVRNILLTNNGGAPVYLTGVELVPPAPPFGLAIPPALPRIVYPGESVVVVVSFQPPSQPHAHQADVTIQYNHSQLLQVHVTAEVRPLSNPLLGLPKNRNLSFGAAYGGQTRSLDVTAQNHGIGALVLQTVTIQPDPGSEGVFSVANSFPIRLAFAGSVQLEFAYSPPVSAQANHRARAALVSNDPQEPNALFQLTGSAAVAALLIQPAEAAFSPSPLASVLPPNLGSTRTIYLYNTGSAPITIFANSFRVLTSAGQPSPHFELLDFNSTPLAQSDRTIVAGSWFGFDIRFRPQTVGAHSAQMTIRSTDPNRAQAVIPVTGTGISA